MRTILIAGRGEAAVRVIRACVDAGYASVAVYADEDASALHARLAGEAIALGAATGGYRSMEALLDAARRAGADAVHPGDGPLAGSAAFARAVEAAGLTWIGPDATTLETLAASARGEETGQGRHLEVPFLGDGRGGVVVIGDRDSSVRRRGRSLIDEAPAPGLTAGERDRIHREAREVCGEARYRGAGTAAFLLAPDGDVTLLGVNAGLSPGHAVTEEVAGVDLVREQFRIAEGRGPSVTETPEPRGHALGFRINAEDAGRGFLPSHGRIGRLAIPGGPGVRWDGGAAAGEVVDTGREPGIGTLVVRGVDRDAALARARRALREAEVTGPATLLPLHRAVLDEDAFSTRGFAVHVRWAATHLMPRQEPQPRPALAEADGVERFAIEADGRPVTLGVPAASAGTPPELLALAAAVQVSDRRRSPRADRRSDPRSC